MLAQVKDAPRVGRYPGGNQLMRSLFEQVVECCGLAPAFARKIIQEACERSDVSPPEAMTPADLIRTLPHIRQALGVFLDPGEVALKTAAMRALVKGSWPSMAAVVPPGSNQETRPPQDEPKAKSSS
ncbi:hypothetical protein predicted by Glimmer/Critica [Sorangium cellulosum So ce56]|uniref:Uncharacterized protein n=2 Tax=Polyangiaceae TaxID=49 RepID=A9GNU3_SORC5|nr:hypothetical protein predicted by Glimmer/Critica [Sorangium cellulosum So ce56]